MFTFVDEKSPQNARGVNTLKRKGLRVSCMNRRCTAKSARQKGKIPMNDFQTTTELAKKPSSIIEGKPGFRTKTIATRLSPDELAEIESVAEQAGKPLSEWLRETALTVARERRADPMELLLAELWAVRYALISLSHAGAQAAAEGKALLPESVLNIRDRADARKAEQARKLLAEFFTSGSANRRDRR
jgi:hypothetical protein